MTPERFSKLRTALARRQPDLTVLMENVHKPHNLSAIVRSCDAVGVLEAHAVVWAKSFDIGHTTSASAGQWVPLVRHADFAAAAQVLKQRGFRLVAAHLSPRAVDFRDLDFTVPTAIVLGQEKYGLTESALGLIDAEAVIPMQGLVASLNVSVAAAVMLFEAQRQRQLAGLYDHSRLSPEVSQRLLFEWSYPEVAAFCRKRDLAYPALDAEGIIVGPIAAR